MSVTKTIQKPVRWRIKPEERRSLLLAGDLLATTIALFFALYFWSLGNEYIQSFSQLLVERIPWWFYLLPLIWSIFMVELYDVRRASRRSDTLRGVGIAALVGFIFYLVLFFFLPDSLPRRGVIGFVVAASVLTITWRFFYINVFTAPAFMRRVLVVGAGRAGCTLLGIVKGVWPPPFSLVGLIDDDESKIGSLVEGYPVLGGAEQLLTVVERENITDLIFAISGTMNPKMFQSLLQAEEMGIEVSTMPKVYEELLGRVPIFLLQSDWILRSFVDEAHTGEFYAFSKRIIDLLCGIAGILIMLPLLPFIIAAILIDSGRPIFYTQIRLGFSGLPYTIIKFRTMQNDAEKDGRARLAQENDGRVTRVGRILRRTHLDELPNFINVLRGDMSMVGPRSERPELVEDLQEKIPFYRARLFVKPGLTGWAQVNYKYASSIEDTAVKLEYDLYYIKHRNLTLDFSIMLRTVGTVVGFRGL
jgi:exopolysaccharide biosynthesis polyprenyl glycosylphosphotransferase